MAVKKEVKEVKGEKKLVVDESEAVENLMEAGDFDDDISINEDIKNLAEFNEFKKRRFLKQEEAVSAEQVKEDRNFIAKCLRTGIELESAFVNDRAELRKMITGSYSILNDYGIERYYQDGTIIPYGQELVITGSNEQFSAYHNKLKRVEHKLRNLTKNTTNIPLFDVNNGSSSCHITLLTSQAKKMPCAYLMNFYQLYRKFSDVILWLGSSTFEKRKEELEYLKRHYRQEIFNKAFPLANKEGVSEKAQKWFYDKIDNFGNNEWWQELDISVKAKIKGAVSEEKIVNPHRIVRRGLLQYANPLMAKSPIINTPYNVFSAYGKYRGINFGKQNLTRGKLHLNGIMIEIRTPDRIAVPSALTSIKCMFEAMLLKSVDLSQYGIMNVECNGSINSWQKTKETLLKICKGQELTEKDRKYLQEKATGFLMLLKPYLIKDNKQAIAILEKLAVAPVSMMYRDGLTNEQIEKKLMENVKEKTFQTETAIRQIIDLQLINGNESREWKRKVAKILGIAERSVEHNLAKINANGEKAYFDDELKSYVVVV